MFCKSQMPWVNLKSDQIGHILKILCNKLSNKSSPSICKLLGYYEDVTLLGNTVIASVWVNLGNFFIEISGHTDSISAKWQVVLQTASLYLISL